MPVTVVSKARFLREWVRARMIWKGLDPLLVGMHTVLTAITERFPVTPTLVGALAEKLEHSGHPDMGVDMRRLQTLISEHPHWRDAE